MDWIFDNIIIIAIVGSVIAQWLKSKKEDGEEPGPQDRPGRKKIDVEQLERNRRLREEIRRKREERQQGNQAPVPHQSPRTLEDLERDIAPQLPPVLREMMGIPDGPEPVRAPQPPPVPDPNPVFDRQQRMREEMEELEKKKREAQAMAKKAGVDGLQQSRRRRAARPEEMSERDFLATLRNPRQARRAVVLREVLGKPLALR